MQNEYFPVVVQALAGEDFSVYAYFTDGTIHKYDMKPLLQKGGVIEQLKDKDFFSQRLTVLNSTVAWDLAGSLIRQIASTLIHLKYIMPREYRIL